MKLWLDDLREPPDKTWAWVKSVEEFEILIRQVKAEKLTIEMASLDHDLGGIEASGKEKTGYDAVKILEREDCWPLRIVVHSWNPEGATRMGMLAKQYTRTVVAPFTAKGQVGNGIF